MNIFNIDFIVIPLPGYPVSFVELAGTLCGLVSVWLTAKNRVSCWPTGIVNILFFLVMFYQVRLYSDMLLQLYFLVMSAYGWWQWTHPQAGEGDARQQLRITNLTPRHLFAVLVFSGAGTLILGIAMLYIHRLLPVFFPQPAALPFPDAFTTVFSIAATVLMAKKKQECWLFWIAVDTACVAIYFVKGIYLVAGEYVVFWVLALNGWLTWRRLQAAEAMEYAS